MTTPNCARQSRSLISVLAGAYYKVEVEVGVLFVGQSSGHFVGWGTANRWNLMQNRCRCRRKRYVGFALGVVGIQDSEWSHQERDGPEVSG
jgi:hypothetical protein